MKELLTKDEIINWYKTAKGILELRRVGKHKSGRLTEEAFNAYTLSVDSHFKDLKKRFNLRLKNGQKQ